MAGMSNSLANNMINWSLRAQSPTQPRTLYYALFTSDPGDNWSSGTEIDRTVATWYQRQPTGAWAAPTNGVTYNTTSVTFPAVTGSSITITHIGIVEGSSATDGTATLLYSQALSSSKTMTVNDQYAIVSTGSSGDFTITMV